MSAACGAFLPCYHAYNSFLGKMQDEESTTLLVFLMLVGHKKVYQRRRMTGICYQAPEIGI